MSHPNHDLIDAAGHLHTRATGEVRIVSLVPSITELVFALGLGDKLVGRTGFCIHPADAVAAVPKVGGTKDVNIEKIRRLAPTHLIVNIDENEKPTVDTLAEFVPNVIVTHPLKVEDNLGLYRLLGAIFGAESKAAELCQQLQQALSKLESITPLPQRVLYCIWSDPWMTVARDTYIADMLGRIGWQQWQAPAGDTRRYPSFDWSPEVVEAIDLVLLSSEPYRFTEAHVDALERQIGKPVMLVDGEMFSWYGSRAILGVEYVRGLV